MAYPRKSIFAPHGAVATSHPLAAAAGLAALRRGGNAVDAALATATTLTVVQPPSNDIGGDLFAIVWDGTRLHGLNAAGRSPAGLTREVVRVATGGRAAEPAAALGGAQARGPAMPARGWLPVTVPGAPAGWRDLHDRFGSLPFADLFADAIGYAEHGHPVSAGVAAAWSRGVAGHVGLTGPEYAEFGRVFAPAGRAPRPGEWWRNPDAAGTLRRIAATGAEDFYRGGIAAALDAHAARTGGLLTGDDLARHTSTWVDPVRARYRRHDVWELPPPGQGLAALLALHVLDGTDLAGLPLAERLHRQVEAVKLGFADTHAHVADPDRAPVPVAALLDPGYAAVRRALVTDRAGDPAAGDPERGGTVYLCAADAGGMMVSLIQSTYLAFGSHVVLPGHGFALQNRGLGFRLDPAHPNVVGPAKRPFHTIIPGFLTRDGAPVGPFGVMGGHMQPQGHVQLLSGTLDGGLDPQAALDAPRWYWHAGRTLLVEPELVATAEGRAAVAELRTRGHQVTVADEPALFGYGQAIWRRPEGGYVVGSESRVDGGAGGY
ncbi:gamma-glutamyltransferase family protein [Micromonospora endolithica]|uniref:Gamma-glutamyltransferase family protein n=1 Tax=Micromonospora endolithica TaxID=230091 RepID=A0A3A9Z4K9_9ACTN|nr:gamma-glutamyltransferase family protein [Micromonospora endolithica]RKN42734.1 gamma-glutamyltransferase family protein [Micromonospora endolithica]TWJ25422.1 gamma-glutamyltranspeptidase/glutathione hydrolase [Micromonospora endolithica]